MKHGSIISFQTWTGTLKRLFEKDLIKCVSFLDDKHPKTTMHKLLSCSSSFLIAKVTICITRYIYFPLSYNHNIYKCEVISQCKLYKL